MNVPEKKPCVACGEDIQIVAKRCPYCHSPQTPDKVGILATVTKWCGGIAIVLSAIMGVGELTRITDAWLEDDVYVQQLAEAAKIAMQQHDNATAGELLNEAFALKPSSNEVRLLRVKLAMHTVRHTLAVLSQDEFDPINEAYSVLYKSLGVEDSIRNDVMAHIGWAVVLLGKSNPEYFFDRVLLEDPDHIYALMYKVAWLLSDWIDSKSVQDEARLQQAKTLFQTARNKGNDSSFAVYRYLVALEKNPKGAVDYIKLVVQEQEIIAAFDAWKIHKIRHEINSHMTRVIRDYALDDNETFEQLFADLDEHEFKQLINFVAASDDKAHQIASDVLLAIYQENKGNLKKALAGYVAAQEKIQNDTVSYTTYLNYVLPDLIRRVCEQLNAFGTEQQCQQ
ncbi:MAG: hypothetical protein KDF59_10835 [Nitrosomonas sp.]|nr:hypothetical protein [Nitrosomonas sp.]